MLHKYWWMEVANFTYPPNSADGSANFEAPHPSSPPTLSIQAQSPHLCNGIQSLLPPLKPGSVTYSSLPPVFASPSLPETRQHRQTLLKVLQSQMEKERRRKRDRKEEKETRDPTFPACLACLFGLLVAVTSCFSSSTHSGLWANLLLFSPPTPLLLR